MVNVISQENGPANQSDEDLILALRRGDSSSNLKFCPLPSYDDFKEATSAYLSRNLEPLVVPQEASQEFKFEIEIQTRTHYCTAHTIPAIRAILVPDLRKKALRTIAEIPTKGPKGKVEVLPLFFFTTKH